MDAAITCPSRSEMRGFNFGVFHEIHIQISDNSILSVLIPPYWEKGATYHGDDGELVQELRDLRQLVFEIVHPHVADVRALERLMLQDVELSQIVTRKEGGLRWKHRRLHGELGACDAGGQLRWELHHGVGRRRACSCGVWV